MLEYPVDEAGELLRKNLETAKLSLSQVEEDLDFIKDQCTTMEVGILSLSIHNIAFNLTGLEGGSRCMSPYAIYG